MTDQPVLEGFSLREVMTPVGIRRKDLRGLDYDTIEESLVGLVVGQTAVRFAMGDLLVFAEGVHSEKYAQLQAATNLSRHTLENYASVSARVAYSRRREELTWSHHEAVARLSPEEQTAYLKRAIRDKLNVDELRAVVREETGDGEGGEHGSAGETRESLSDVAHRVWIHAQRDGDRYLVPVEDMLALARAIGAAT